MIITFTQGCTNSEVVAGKLQNLELWFGGFIIIIIKKPYYIIISKLYFVIQVGLLSLTLPLLLCAGSPLPIGVSSSSGTLLFNAVQSN